MFKCLAEESTVRDAFRINEEAGRILSAYHEHVMRGPSRLSPEDRELIATYVSGLNDCCFCHETHAYTAEAMGRPRALTKGLVADPELKDADPKLRPILAFARKLTLAQTEIEVADAEAVHAAWDGDEGVLHDAILVIATFNFMNRFVHGHGIRANEEIWADRGRWLARNGYSGVVDAGRAQSAMPVGEPAELEALARRH